MWWCENSACTVWSFVRSIVLMPAQFRVRGMMGEGDGCGGGPTIIRFFYDFGDGWCLCLNSGAA